MTKAASEKVSNRNVYWLWLSAIIIGLDQITKRIVVNGFELYERVEVTSFFNLTRAHNHGAAFSFLADAGGWQKFFFIGLGIAVSIFIMIWLRTVPRGRSWTAIGLCLLLGGALGNVIDRAVYGYVVDFLDFHFDWLGQLSSWFPGGHWPAFNVADIAISLAALMLISESVLDQRRATKESAEEPAKVKNK